MKVLGRLPEIFDFYTAVEPGNPERYEARNVSIGEELKGITYIDQTEEVETSEDIDDIEVPNFYYNPDSSSHIDEMIEDALFELALDETNAEDAEEEALKVEDDILE
ncbi:MAG: hypothetical protein MJ246_06065 [Clostridia bacterium]|nr:hypothetical protein [Clostridia bacterium]